MIPIYISHATPHTSQQCRFIQDVKDYFRGFDMLCENVYVSDYRYVMESIRDKIKTCCGIVIVAYERKYMTSAIHKRGADLPGVTTEVMTNVSETTPFIHIEAAMAMAYDLPVIVLKEKGILAEGVLDTSYHGAIRLDFDFNDPSFFHSREIHTAVSSFYQNVISAVSTE